MENGWCPRLCLPVIIVSLLLYFPLEHFLPEEIRKLSAFLLTCSIGVFLTWCVVCFIAEHRRPGHN